MPVGGADTPLDLGRRQGGEGFEKTAPDRTRRAVLRDIFVGNSGQRHIVAHPLRHAAAAGTGFVSLSDSLVGHPRLPRASSLVFNARVASASRGSRGIPMCVAP